MSVNMDNGEVAVETEDAPYSDHEHVNLSIGTDTPSGGGLDAFPTVEPVAGELDGHQIAELVAVTIRANVDAGQLEFGIGYNLQENDFIEQAQGNRDKDFNFGGGEIQGAIYEEPAVIDFLQIGDANDADAVETLREINYRDLYTNGPFIDSTDNLDLHVETSNAAGEGTKAQVMVQLVYRVIDVAEGVPQFADPRRLMDQ